MLTEQKTSALEVKEIIDTLYQELRLLGEKLQSNKALRAVLNDALKELVNKRTDLNLKASQIQEDMASKKIELRAVELNLETQKAEAAKPAQNSSNFLSKFFGQTGPQGNATDTLQPKLAQLQKEVAGLFEQQRLVIEDLGNSNKAIDIKCEEIRQNLFTMIEATQTFYTLIKKLYKENGALKDTQVLMPEKKDVSRFNSGELKQFLDGLLNILAKNLKALDMLHRDKSLLNVTENLAVFQSPSVVKTPANLPQTKQLNFKGAPKELFPEEATAEKNRALTAENEALKVDNEALKEKLSAAEKNLEYAQEQQALFQTQFNDFKKQNEEALQKQTKLNEQQAQALQKLTTDLQTKTEEYSKLTEGNQALQQSLNQLSSQVETYSQEVSGLKNTVAKQARDIEFKQGLIMKMAQKGVERKATIEEQEVTIENASSLLDLQQHDANVREKRYNEEVREAFLVGATITPQYNTTVTNIEKTKKAAEALTTDGKAKVVTNIAKAKK